MRAGVVVTVLSVLVLSGCGGADDGGTKPTFGGDAPDVTTADLAAAKADAGIRDCPAAGGAPAADDPLPDLQLQCLGGGRAVTLAELEGPAVLNLWASWCKPCREELPLLARLDEELGDEVQVIGVDVADAAPDAALELAARSGATYPQLADPDSTTRGPLRVAGLPQTIFVDAGGTMVATERVPFRSYDDLTDAVSRHLGVRP